MRTALFPILVILLILTSLGGGPAQSSDDYVTYLGTSSAGGLPWTRLCSSLFVSPDIVIDYCSMYYAGYYPLHYGRLTLTRCGVSPAVINHILITHSHGDHFDEPDIVALAQERSQFGAQGKLHVYGNPKVVGLMQTYMIANGGQDKVELHTLHQFDSFTAGQWSGKALAAAHDYSQECLIYVLRKDGRSLLYATDTGMFPTSTFNALASESLDLAIVECTWYGTGPPPPPSTHMTWPEPLTVKETLELQGTMKSHAKFALTHTDVNDWSKSQYDPIRRTETAAEGVVLPVDGLRIDLETERTAAQVKKTPDHYVIDPDGNDLLVGTVVGMSDVVVSATTGAVGPDFFYVQADNRTAGIRVEGSTAGLDVGDVVDVIGIVMTDGVEREVRFPMIQTAGTGGVAPLFICNSSVGGTTDGPALGATDGLGPNNVGLLVRVSGQVMSYAGSEFVVTDGSTDNGITCRASAGITIPETGFAIVTGVVSLEEVGGAREVVILIREQQDIQ